MDTREIKREANLLYKEILPLLELDVKYERFLLADLAQVVLICGHSKQDVTPNELLGFLVTYALVKDDKDKLNAVINQWDISSDIRRAFQKEAVQILLSLKGEIGQEDKLTLPSVLNKLDEERGTNFLNKIVNAIYRFAQVIVKADGTITLQEMEALSLVWKLLHTYDAVENSVKETTSTTTSLSEKEGLDAVLDQLNQLIGMENIKEEVRTLTNFLKVQKLRAERGLAKTPVSLHSVFSGPPGTGKTTVARLVSKIFKELGFLEKGHLVETDRAGMVADYIGGTSKKVDEKVTSALDGVLFIDEAYALTPEDSARDFGQEAVNVLLKRMEDYRNRLVVIAAGYTDEMLRFVESNPGLKSRFNRYFYFNDYTPDELVAIFNKFCKDSHFNPTEAANQKLKELLTRLYETRDRTFGNARLVRNLFEKTIEQQANRLAVINTLTDEILITILPDDIPAIATVTPQQSRPAANRDAIGEADSAEQQTFSSNFQDRGAFIDQLTTLMNQSLQPMGITAKFGLRENTLQAMFEADSVPDPAEMAALTGSLLKRGAVDNLARIQLYGRASGDEFPAWSQEFDLGR